MQQRKAISSIVGAFFFIVIMAGAFVALTTVLDVNSDFLKTQIDIAIKETEKTQEKFDLVSCVNDFDNRLFVEITNNGANPVEIRDILIVNSSHTDLPLAFFEPAFEDSIVPVGFTNNILADQPLFLNVGNYDIKVVSRSGTIQQKSLAVGEKVLEGSFKGIFTDENLDDPTFLAIGPAPNYHVYVSNERGDTVNKYKFPSGDYIVNVFVDLPISGLDRPAGMTFGPTAGNNDDLYVISEGDDEVLRFDGTTGDFIRAFVDSNDNGGLDGGYDLEFDSSNKLYVSDTDGQDENSANRILRFTASGAFEQVFYSDSNTPPLDDPRGIAFDSSGNLYVANDDDDNIVRITPGGTGSIYYAAATSPPLDNPQDIAFDSRNYLYVANSDDNNIINITAANTATILAGAAHSIDDPRYLAVDSNNAVYVSNDDDDNVVKCTKQNTCSEFISSSEFDKPRGLVFNSTLNKLYVGDRDDNLVKRFETDGSLDVVFVKEIGALDEPQAMDFGPDGNLYVAAEGSEGVFRYFTNTFSKSGVFVGSQDNSLRSPVGLKFGSNGKMYVTKHNDDTDEVFRYNIDSSFDGKFIPDGSQIDWIKGIFFDDSGKLLIASHDDDEVLRYSSTGSFESQLISGGLGGLDQPFEAIIGPDDKIYVTSSNDDEVLRYNSGGTFDKVFVTDGSGGLDEPIGIVFDPNGDLMVASFQTDQVLIYQGPQANVNFTCALAAGS